MSDMLLMTKPKEGFRRGLNRGMASSADVYTTPTVRYSYRSAQEAFRDDAKRIKTDVARAKAAIDREITRAK